MPRTSLEAPGASGGAPRSPRGANPSPRGSRRQPGAVPSPRGGQGQQYQMSNAVSPRGGGQYSRGAEYSRSTYPATVGAPVAAGGGGGGGGKGYDEVPKADCCYWNEDDPRACVCTVDSCGKRNCTPNLGTTQGKLIAAVCWGGPLVFAIIMMAAKRGGGEEKGERDADDRLLQEEVVLVRLGRYMVETLLFGQDPGAGLPSGLGGK